MLPAHTLNRGPKSVRINLSTGPVHTYLFKLSCVHAYLFKLSCVHAYLAGGDVIRVLFSYKIKQLFLISEK